jgi:PAS domain S-box-containing protein
VDLNEGSMRIFGVRREDALGHPIAHFLALAEARAPGLAEFGALSVDPSVLVDRELELVASGPDGRAFAAELTVAQAGVSPPLFIIWIRDVSVQNAEAIESVRRFAMLAHGEEIAGIGSWDWDVRSGQLRWSDNLFRLFGLNPVTVTPTLQDAIECVHADDRERVRRTVETAVTTGHLDTLEFRLVRVGGALRRMQCIVASVEREDGAPRRFLGAVQDVTERPRRSVGLQELTAREREILQLAAQGMSTKAIARHLTLSPLTVKTHFENVYAKWGAPDRASAVAKALREGLIE